MRYFNSGTKRSAPTNRPRVLKSCMCMCMCMYLICAKLHVNLLGMILFVPLHVSGLLSLRETDQTALHTLIIWLRKISPAVSPTHSVPQPVSSVDFVGLTSNIPRYKSHSVSSMFSNKHSVEYYYLLQPLMVNMTSILRWDGGIKEDEVCAHMCVCVFKKE